MGEKSLLFDKEWEHKVRSTPTSWAIGEIETPTWPGYCATIQAWFDEFPLDTEQKAKLRCRLESLQRDDHLGALNELAWWKFMLKERLTVSPLPPSKKEARPDFEVTCPVNFFVEVTTLNLSANDKKTICKSIPLDHAETAYRVVGKQTCQKIRQLKMASSRGRPAVLVVFDYSTWSAFATSFFRKFADYLFLDPDGFKRLAPDLSAIVYAERKVLEDEEDVNRIRIVLSRQRSAVYYNPRALHRLPLGIFPSINQFWLAHSGPDPDEHWVYL